MNPLECSRCLHNNEIPGVKIYDDELCSVCKEYDRLWSDWGKLKEKRLAELMKILNKFTQIIEKGDLFRLEKKV